MTAGNFPGSEDEVGGREAPAFRRGTFRPVAANGRGNDDRWFPHGPVKHLEETQPATANHLAGTHCCYRSSHLRAGDLPWCFQGPGVVTSIQNVIRHDFVCLACLHVISAH